MLYLLQVTVYTGLMFLVYLIFLRNRPAHGFNRAYLLATALLPVLLPFISFPQMQQQMQAVNIAGLQLPEIRVGQGQQATVGNAATVAWAVYRVVAVFIFMLTARRWWQLGQFINRSEKQPVGDYTLIPNSGYGPCSWHKYIILPGSAQDEVVVQHELAHLRLHHTKDMVLLSILHIIFWPKIFLIWLRRELELVHEFQADAAVGGDRRAYAQLLVSSIFTGCTLPATHSFIIHPIQRRIMMLKKQKGKMSLITSMVLAGCAAGLVLTSIIGLQSCASKKWELKEEAETRSNSVIQEAHIYQTLTFAEKMPEYPGGSQAMMEYMSKNLKYPKEAKEKKIQGRVTVQFIVDMHGNVVMPEIKKSPDPSLSAAALDVVQKMPKWIPGEEKGQKVAVQYTLPIAFQL